MSSWLLRRSSSPLMVAHARACAPPYASLSILSSPLSTSRPSSRSRPHFAVSSLSRPLVLPVGNAFVAGKTSPVLAIQLKRFYSPGRNPWQSGNDWKSTLKTGGLVLLGTGALIASTSLAFGLVIAGAAGFGVYTLYQRFISQYRSRFGSSDPFRNVNSNIDALNDMFSRSRRRTKSAVQDDLDSLVQGMPLVVRGLVKTVFSFLGKAMQSSMERAGELRRRTDEYLQANKRVRDQMGDNVSVGGPEQWMESNRNRQTGDVIDLLRDSSVGGRRKTVIDAEYVDLDDENSRYR
ncbi:Hypothetical protein PHPALM_1225 [Phytophthora palmivora]|uniref:Uncharacterized protein n=1 Tax=Phytophthora palmivora TaxID=4796 RepID=A0A2P4YSV0_9STRA|nr:Hypothetical protein PHPALM_1225 [Phytophthora palmivora]